ncbi:MAG: rhodanese-like domain-containing protein [Akkermansiaceae bacterium]|nr:rhodanese-like domain-containing protein [Akkermansiaceae bacterium]
MTNLFTCVALLLLLTACNPVLNSSEGVGGLEQVTIPVNEAVDNEANDHQNQVNDDHVKRGLITGVDIERLFSLLQAEQLLLVDCRPQLYYRIGHIDSAVNLPYRKYEARLSKIEERLDQALAARKVVVLYCQNYTCPDAYLFAKKIAAKGYSCSVYKGGWQEWKASGL